MQFDQLKRREFITLFGGAVLDWPLAARAQQPDRLLLLFAHAGASAIFVRPNAHSTN